MLSPDEELLRPLAYDGIIGSLWMKNTHCSSRVAISHVQVIIRIRVLNAAKSGWNKEHGAAGSLVASGHVAQALSPTRHFCQAIPFWAPIDLDVRLEVLHTRTGMLSPDVAVGTQLRDLKLVNFGTSKRELLQQRLSELRMHDFNARQWRALQRRYLLPPEPNSACVFIDPSSCVQAELRVHYIISIMRPDIEGIIPDCFCFLVQQVRTSPAPREVAPAAVTHPLPHVTKVLTRAVWHNCNVR